MIDIMLPVNDAIMMSFAGVAELADASDSKSDVGNNVPVQVRPPAPVSQSLAGFSCEAFLLSQKVLLYFV